LYLSDDIHAECGREMMMALMMMMMRRSADLGTTISTTARAMMMSDCNAGCLVNGIHALMSLLNKGWHDFV
jgi:hypothetical protein